jgi:hypothetical protein
MFWAGISLEKNTDGKWAYTNNAPHYIPLGKCKLKRDTATSLLKRWKSRTTTSNVVNEWGSLRYRAAGTLLYCWWECKMIQELWKRFWQFLAKLNILSELAVVLFGNYPNELKSTQKYCSLFIIVKTWKQDVLPRWVE